MSSTRVLGITGGIASGKSLVADCLAGLGAEVISADEIARDVVRPGEGVLEQLVSLFGREILLASGELDRERLAAMVFRDEEQRQRLNAVMHPAIAAVSKRRLQEMRHGDLPLVVYEAPLLFEANAENRVDYILVVYVEAEVQLDRLCARDDISREAAEARVAAQWPQHRKIAGADYVIDNSGPVDRTRQHVRTLYEYLTRDVPGSR